MDYIKTTRIDPVIIMRSVHRKCVARQCITYVLVRQNKYYMKCKTMCLWLLILMFKRSEHMDRLVDESFVLFLTSCVPPPPDNTHEVWELLNLFLALAHIPQPSQSIRFRHFAEDKNVFTDRNVYSQQSGNRYHVYQLTGETPETMIDLQNLIVLHDTREHMLSACCSLYGNGCIQHTICFPTCLVLV